MDAALSNKHRNFKGQLPDETIVCFTRKHSIQVVPYIVAAFIVSMVSIALPFAVSQQPLIDALGQSGFFTLGSIVIFALTYATHFLFTKIFNYYLRIFLVTNQRIIDLHKTLFITDQRLTVMLSEIQDVSMDKVGIIPTLLNYGTLNIVVSGTSQTKSIHRIPNPDYHFRKIVQARQEYMNRIARLQGAQSAQPEHAQEQWGSVAGLDGSSGAVPMRSIFRPLPVESVASDAVLPLQ